MNHRRRRSVVKASDFERNRLREALDNERALTGTLRGYVAKRDVSIQTLEADNAVLRARVEGLEREVQALRSAPPVEVPRRRERLPDERRSDTWTLRVGPRDTGTSCTLHVGFYDDGRVGEVFLRFNKRERGGHGAAMADFAVTMLSIALQYGAPLSELVDKMVGACDESGGVTRVRVELDDGTEEQHADPDVPMCQSLRDYIGKKLRARYCMPQPINDEITNENHGGITP